MERLKQVQQEPLPRMSAVEEMARKKPMESSDFVQLCQSLKTDNLTITPLQSKYLIELAALQIAIEKTYAMNRGDLDSEKKKQHTLLLNMKRYIDETNDDKKKGRLHYFNKYLLNILCHNNKPTLNFGTLLLVNKKTKYDELIAYNNELRKIRPGPKVIVIVITAHGSYRCKSDKPTQKGGQPKISPVIIDLKTEYKNIKNFIYLGLTAPKKICSTYVEDNLSMEINSLFQIELDNYLLRQIDDESIEKHFINEQTKNHIQHAFKILRASKEEGNEIILGTTNITAPQASVIYNRETANQKGILIDKNFYRIKNNEFIHIIPEFMGEECSFDYYLKFVKNSINRRKDNAREEAKADIERRIRLWGATPEKVAEYEKSKAKDIEDRTILYKGHFDAILNNISSNKMVTLSEIMDAYSYEYKGSELNIIIIDQTCNSVNTDCKQQAFDDIATLDIGAPISDQPQYIGAPISDLPQNGVDGPVKDIKQEKK